MLGTINNIPNAEEALIFPFYKTPQNAQDLFKCMSPAQRAGLTIPIPITA